MSVPKKYREGTIYRLGEKIPVKISQLKVGESITVVNDDPDDRRSTLFTVYQPPRRANESPIEYYKRTTCVDDRYYFKYKERYYCNPAHCRKTWRNKQQRDEHLDRVYAIL